MITLILAVWAAIALALTNLQPAAPEPPVATTAPATVIELIEPTTEHQPQTEPCEDPYRSDCPTRIVWEAPQPECYQMTSLLFHTGDYLPAMRATLGEEDSATVDAILSAREAYGTDYYFDPAQVCPKWADDPNG